MKQKLDTAYKTIGEVAKDLNLINLKNGKFKTHTIRYWEKEYKQIKPNILASKRRQYDQEAIKILKKIKVLLKEKGFTINGVKKFLANESSFRLDEINNKTIKSSNKNFKLKVEKISSLIKEIKKLS